ncbi:alanine racemase [Francisella sp. SYW-9]|uniref:alanine racemase n=1 Tax=Francisella sp. SYW-9 TaxID=2610888 RepID=UPI001CD04922|nr:alanine racemase [Francisella sp. SYW-9]
MSLFKKQISTLVETPRLVINLHKIEHNTKVLVDRLNHLNISVIGVTKVIQSSQIMTDILIKAGVIGLGDSHIGNIELVNKEKNLIQTYLIRSPMLSQIKRVVLSKTISFNSEITIIKALSKIANKLNLIHEVVLMIELGDLREGILPENILKVVKKVLTLPNIHIKGIGTNLMCLNGSTPDNMKMNQLSSIANSIEKSYNIKLDIISGGNSANLSWALNSKNNIGRINNLRLGEAIFLGIDPLDNTPIKGLYQDAIYLVAEVIESKLKTNLKGNHVYQSILAFGNQDIVSNGIKCLSEYNIIGATSDHLVINSANKLIPVGTELHFVIDYNSLLRAMISPLVNKFFIPDDLSYGSSQNTCAN